MKKMNNVCWEIIGVSVLFLLITSNSGAADKVVVVPLMGKTSPPAPYAPLASVSPSNSDYTIGSDIVLDKVTGLMWQKTDDNIQRDWYNASNYCQSLKPPAISDWSDWRLPSVDELMSIVNYGLYEPAISAVAFPVPKLLRYWSALTYASNSANAWSVHFRYGVVDFISKSTSLHVRCVRKLSDYSKFKDNGNGTVTDLATGLMWQREDDNNERLWGDANIHCQGLSLGGYQNWRVPNIKELQSIVDRRVVDPGIDGSVFPNTIANTYWSATTSANNNTEAWVIDFSNDFVAPVFKASHTWYVRCVR